MPAHPHRLDLSPRDPWHTSCPNPPPRRTWAQATLRPPAPGAGSRAGCTAPRVSRDRDLRVMDRNEVVGPTRWVPSTHEGRTSARRARGRSRRGAAGPRSGACTPTPAAARRPPNPSFPPFRSLNGAPTRARSAGGRGRRGRRCRRHRGDCRPGQRTAGGGSRTRRAARPARSRRARPAAPRRRRRRPRGRGRRGWRP
jgi:hypothetical protein